MQSEISYTPGLKINKDLLRNDNGDIKRYLLIVFQFEVSLGDSFPVNPVHIVMYQLDFYTDLFVMKNIFYSYLEILLQDRLQSKVMLDIERHSRKK